MSPEQVQGERGDARSDIYSWGVMMYEFLTGRLPFEGDNWMAVMAGKLQKTPEGVRHYRPDVPPALEAVVLHAMRRFPDHRYASAAEIVEDLQHLDTLPPSVYDNSPEPAIGGMAAIDSNRRLWAFVGVVAGSFVALVALIIVLTLVFR